MSSGIWRARATNAAATCEGNGARSSTDLTWTAIVAHNDGSTSVTGFPSGYTDGQFSLNDGSADGVGLGVAHKNEAKGEEDAGAYALDNSEACVLATLCVIPAHAAITEQVGTTEIFRQEWNTAKANAGAMTNDFYATAAMGGASVCLSLHTLPPCPTWSSWRRCRRGPGLLPS